MKTCKLPGYKKTNEDDAFGTCFQSYIEATFSDLVNLLGKPEDGDGYKVSGCWTLTDMAGNCVTLYDWKQTKLYSDEYWSVRQFRANKFAQRFHIGAKNLLTAELFRFNLIMALHQQKTKMVSKKLSSKGNECALS